MTRRDDALIPLNHDHHHALARARRLRGISQLDELQTGATSPTTSSTSTSAARSAISMKRKSSFLHH